MCIRDRYSTARLGDNSMADHTSPCLDRRVNLLCDGIITAEVALAALGPDALAGRTTIFRPVWVRSGTTAPKFLSE